MIQSLKKLSLALFIICFFFTQRGLVYAQGVTIDFSSFSAGSIQINTQSWGNINTPSQPTTPTTTGTLSTTYLSAPTSPSNSGITSTINLTGFNSSNQRYNSTAGQLGYNPTDPTGLTKDLIRPSTFSPLSEKEPLLPNAENFIVTVCLSLGSIHPSACSDEVTSKQASEKLAEIILDKYFKGTESRPFIVFLHSTIPMEQQKQMLHQIEIQASAIAESRIFKADGIFIKEYDKIAREEADSGVNWTHISKDDKSIHDFNTKKAFTKLKNFAVQEKSLSSKNFKNN